MESHPHHTPHNKKSDPPSPHEDFEPDENPPLIDFDFQTGKFNLKTIHPSLKKIFKTLGISKKDLKDKRMVPVIFDGLIKAFSELHVDNMDKKAKPKASIEYIEEDEKDNKKDVPHHKEGETCTIKFDLKLGVFEIDNLHPTLKRIFKKAKITKKDLRNKEMAISIMQAIMESFCEMHDLSESVEMMKSGEMFK